MVEGTPLLREHTGQNLYRGFESLSLRQKSLWHSLAIARLTEGQLVLTGPHQTKQYSSSERLLPRLVLRFSGNQK